LSILHGYEETGLLPHVEQWNNYDCYRDKTVRILSGEQYEEGVASGISKTGELLLLTPDGRTKKIMSGEVSLRLSE
ncbi:MAG: bifunctional biotin--[acetyl-CoA-carboxylase] synthetase/biotin operon repressor, partial [Cycloclasticus pugetii]